MEIGMSAKADYPKAVTNWFWMFAILIFGMDSTIAQTALKGQGRVLGEPARAIQRNAGLETAETWLFGGANDEVYKIDPTSLTATLLGNTGFQSAPLLDIAYAENGRLFAILDPGRLVEINRVNGSAILVGATGFPTTNALVAATGNTFYAATVEGEFLRVSSITGGAELVGTYGGGLGSTGDLVIGRDGTLYAIVHSGLCCSTTFLATVNSNTGHATVVGAIGFADVYGLTFGPDGGLYAAAHGDTSSPKLITINRTTGAGSLLGQITGVTGMAGLTTVPGLFADSFENTASVSINDVVLTEGNSGATNATFTVTLVGTVAGGFAVPVFTTAGTAAVGTDYTSIPLGTSLSFTGTAGETRSISVPVLGDTVVESNETFQVVLGSPSAAGVSLTDSTGLATINNDDTASIAINDVSVIEGNAGTSNATFTVGLTGAVQGGFTVPVSSANVTATAGTDYTAIAAGSSLSFTGTTGQTRTISVSVVGDTLVESNESFQVLLGAPSVAGVSASDATGVGIINNDDAASVIITSFAPINSTVTPSSSISLAWTSSGTTSCSGSQGGSTIWSSLGSLAASGTQLLTAPAVAGTVTFQLNCTNGTQSTSATTQVNVQPVGGSCTPLYPNGSVNEWSSVFAAWPAYGVRPLIAVPFNGYVAYRFTATAVTGQFGTVAAFDFLGDGDGWGQFSISTEPGCFNPLLLHPNCLSSVARSAGISWMNGSGAFFSCNLTPGQSYYLNFTYGASNVNNGGPFCPSGSCSTYIQNQLQD